MTPSTLVEHGDEAMVPVASVLSSSVHTAGAHLAQLLDEADRPEEIAVRVERGTTGALTLRFDHVQPDDLTVEHEERTVLVFDTDLAETLGGKTIDAKDAEEGTEFVIQG